MRVGFYSDAYYLPTGYGRNTLNLMSRLKDICGHEVFEISPNHIGPPIEPVAGMPIFDGRTGPMTVRLIRKLKPDVMIHIRDNWSFIRRWQPPGYHLWPACKSVGAKLINYTPIESCPMPLDLVDTVTSEGDLTIVHAKWCVDQLVAQGAPEDRLRVLRHGVEPRIFHPGVGDRKAAGLPDGEMLLQVASNTERKMVPLTFIVLKKLIDSGRDAFLYYHGPRQGFFSLDTHANALGLAGKKRIFVKATDDPSPVNLDGFEDRAMANLYRTADVYVTTTAGEGEGVPILEALASGLPTVMTDTPILRELYGTFPHAYFIKSKQEFPTPWGFDWIADTDSGADLVNRAMADPRPTTVEVPSYFKWDNITRTLEGYLEEVSGRK